MADVKNEDTKKDLKNNINDIIKKNKPNITASSIKTYTSYIINLMKKLKVNNIDYLDTNYEDVINSLKDIKPSNRKTIYSSLIVLLNDNDNDNKKSVKEYRKLLELDAQQSKKDIEKNIKTDKQNDKWISQDELKNKYDYLKKATAHLMKQTTLNLHDLNILQNYIILSLYYLNPPRRLNDYVFMKIHGDINKDEDNYIDKKEFVFNKYKTKKTYGTQRIEINKDLLKILNKWIKLNTYDYLLIDTKGRQLSNVQLNQRLNNMGIYGVNMLRHLFVNNLYPSDMPSVETINKVSQDMGHSVEENLLYRKK
jgi:integrase